MFSISQNKFIISKNHVMRKTGEIYFCVIVEASNGNMRVSWGREIGNPSVSMLSDSICRCKRCVPITPSLSASGSHSRVHGPANRVSKLTSVSLYKLDGMEITSSLFSYF